MESNKVYDIPTLKSSTTKQADENGGPTPAGSTDVLK
ncbi:hypothetical protein J2S05_000510 [Alkalicoccobacillus murimartini]|uniref:Lasso RiPP family leader peptide-containing protein n=1 Tax=Alkalicoccobacillus murimartini TaxID=171685 RepID=A0ABT9YDC6_9BACI|nr:hypothetical protein [Alkalicoccobacillus murimartini]